MLLVLVPVLVLGVGVDVECEWEREWGAWGCSGVIARRLISSAIRENRWQGPDLLIRS